MASWQKHKEAKKVGFPRRGEIYWVAFDPAMGREIKKTRPALIIQNDVSNRYSPVTIVAAISSHFATPPHPREVVVEPRESGLPKASAVLVNQIRTVDRLRLIRRSGALEPATMRRVDDAIKISLGLTLLHGAGTR
jgi:mRNA interferase MazF